MLEKNIKDEMESVVSEYLLSEEINLDKFKYFYCTLDFFLNELKLEYKIIDLNLKDKRELKKRIVDNDERVIIVEDSLKKILKFKKYSNIIEDDNFIKSIKNKKKQKKFLELYEEFLLYFYLNNSLKGIQKVNFVYLYIKFMFEYQEIDSFLRNILKNFKKNPKKINLLKNIKCPDKIKLEELRIKNLYINEKYRKELEFIYYGETECEVNKVLNELTIPSNLSKKFFYRGQANSKFEITPSISRNQNFLEYEHKLFFDLLSLKPNEFLNDNTIYEKLITMQHFNLPTRLIDLTRNPLIALYFCCNEDFHTDGILYIIEENDDEILNFGDFELDCLTKIVKMPYQDIIEGKLCKECDKCANIKNIEKSYIVNGIAKNQRINNQSGDFIFVGIGENEKYMKELSQKPTKMIVISKLLKKDILDNLKLFNIHPGTVYPELANMSQYLKEEYREKRNINS